MAGRGAHKVLQAGATVGRETGMQAVSMATLYEHHNRESHVCVSHNSCMWVASSVNGRPV